MNNEAAPNGSGYATMIIGILPSSNFRKEHITGTSTLLTMYCTAIDLK
jgi:hypothetical protein